MEIFYSIVPDPSARYGNEFPEDLSIDYIKAVLAHEFQHMIMFNYRVLIYGQGLYATYIEELWLDEGLAHIAEDLNGFNNSNIARANDFLKDPVNANLVFKELDTIKSRGAIYLFLRLLGDRFGSGIFKSLVQSRNRGTANVEAVVKEHFKELFADWSAACYLSGLGITSDKRFNYSSIDLRTQFDPLAYIEFDCDIGEMSGYMQSHSPEFILFSIPSEGSPILSISSESTGRMNAVLIRLQ
jgi:hypothetical protein